MCKYLELKKENQKKFDEFAKDKIYWIFAFSNNEFDKKLNELNLKRDDIASIGAGGFIKKTDIKAYNEFSKNISNEFEQIKNNDEEVKKAFMYELANHEYCITYDLTDTLEALGLEYETFKNDDRLLKIMIQAEADYLKNRDNL